MMTMNKFPFYWQTNDEWLDTDEKWARPLD